jgi:BRCT domain type II-containing protein
LNITAVSSQKEGKRMASETHQVGDIVESTCRKCNDVTGHAVVSIVEGQIAKVECRGCGSVHKHRPAKKSGQPKAAKSSSRSEKGKSTASKGKKSQTAKEKEAQQIAEQIYHEWQTKTQGKNQAEAKKYRMDGEFAANDLIDHASFGLGVVQRIIPPNKMDVLFQDSEKRLRCAMVSRSSGRPGNGPDSHAE